MDIVPKIEHERRAGVQTSVGRTKNMLTSTLQQVRRAVDRSLCRVHAWQGGDETPGQCCGAHAMVTGEGEVMTPDPLLPYMDIMPKIEHTLTPYRTPCLEEEIDLCIFYPLLIYGQHA